MPSIETDGWELMSAEARHGETSGAFEIPPQADREALVPGDAAQLLFDIETRESGRVVDRGVDRMWAIVKTRTSSGYSGVLDSDPGSADGVRLRRGDLVLFGPEHVARIDRPPREYLLRIMVGTSSRGDRTTSAMKVAA